VIELSLLSFEDQRYAQACQAILAEALKHRAKRIATIVQPLSDGPFCRFGVKMSSGSTLFTGEPFLPCWMPWPTLPSPAHDPRPLLLYPPVSAPLSSRLRDQLLPLRVLALTLEQAATHAASAGPDLYEPMLEIFRGPRARFCH